MTVQELIDQLQKIEDKSLPIWGLSWSYEAEDSPLERIRIEEPEYDRPRRVMIDEGF